MSKYAFWNKQDTVYTPSGEEFTAEQWKDRYKWTKIPNVKVVMSGNIFNGAFIAEFEQFKTYYKKQGAAITDDMTDEQVLACVEAFEAQSATVEAEPTAEERIAAALEFQNLNSLEG